ncbi:MAG: hypothetical protein ACRDHD_04040 [Candidatus Limnocylindria bacterium]
MTNRWRHTPAAGLLCAAVALAACGAEASPGVSASVPAEPSSVATAEPTASPTPAGSAPEALTGRIEIEEHGFAIEVPNGWEAVDLTGDDVDVLVEQMESTFPALEGISAQVTAILQAGGAIFAVDQDPSRVADGFAANLNMIVAPAGGMTLDLLLAANAQAIETGLQPVTAVETSTVQLPAGEAGRLTYDLEPSGLTRINQVQYYVVHDGNAYILTLSRAASQAEREGELQAIAESLEFL